MSTKIYTKTGDKGSTGLIGGKRVSKSHERIEAYGTVDELNSYLGLVSDAITIDSKKEELKYIQDRLFTVGSNLACDDENAKMILPDLTENDIILLEKSIDQMDTELEPLKNFIIPGGHIHISYCHIARCVCRRAERLCVQLMEHSFVPPLIIQYLNRLSDYLFALSRYIGKHLGVAEIVWEPRKVNSSK